MFSLRRAIGITTSALLLALPEVCLAGPGAQALSQFVNLHVIENALVVFEGVAAACVFYYGIQMIFESYKDEAYTNATNSFIYAATGFGIIAVSQAFVSSFYLTVSPQFLIPGIESAISFMLTGMGGLMVLMLTIDGIKMIAAQGDTGERTRIIKVITMHAMGVAVSFMAFAVVHAVSDSDTAVLIIEIKGFVTFLLTVLGTLCVVALIAAGTYLIISIDESYRDQAKKTIVGTLFTLALVMASYTILITFL